ncbi:MAG: DUF5685 family protein [Clostridiaceae bacterium]|nr:DUF5685 family protein [Clostridiaceae bacterium]
MFGYVTPLNSELKVKDYNRFRGYYCGLCQSIKGHFGHIPRMTLNYDMTFLAIFLDALAKEETKAELKRCIVHPTTKRAVINDNNPLKYAAAMNVSLVYFKLLDDVNDDNDFKSKSLSKVLSPYKNKFTKEIENINTIIKEQLNKLSLYEENLNFTSIDEVCDPFSEIVGKILELYPYEIIEDNEDTRYLMYRFGYSLGKWIYLIDALDDLEEDMTKNKFNPINYLYNTENENYEDFLKRIKDRIEFSIFSSACTCHEVLEQLPIKKNKDILMNIIDLGMMDKYVNITKRKSKENLFKDEINKDMI